MKLLRIIFCFSVSFLLPISIFSQDSMTIFEEMQVITFISGKDIEVAFVPDAKFPGVQGEAKVELNSRGTASLKASFKNMPSVFDLGNFYSSYVIWAVLPDGTSQRLGEVKTEPKKKVSDGKFEADVPFNTFGIFITVEPHYLVRIPSRAIVLKNSIVVGKDSAQTKISTVQCALNEDFFRNRPKLDKKKEKEFRRTPISLVAARNAVALARFAGAETYSSDLYAEADSLLEEAEEMFRNKSKENRIDLIANKAIGVAANAEIKAVGEIGDQTEKNREVRAKTELNKLKDDVKTLETQKKYLEENLERVRREKDNLNRDYIEKYNQSERLQIENKELKEKFNSAQTELNRLKIQNERLLGVQTFREEFPALVKFIGVFGKISNTNDEITLILPNNIWLKEEEGLLDETRLETLQPLLKKIAEKKYLQVVVYSFVYSKNDVVEGQALADSRAAEIAKIFVSGGVSENRITKDSFLQNQGVNAVKKSKQPDRIEVKFRLIK